MDDKRKLYRAWDGKLETATFVSEQILEGATLPSWVVRFDAYPSTAWTETNGRIAITSPEDWELTELAAWKRCKEELKECGPGLVQALKDAQAALTQCTDQLNVAAEKITQLTGRE